MITISIPANKLDDAEALGQEETSSLKEFIKGVAVGMNAEDGLQKVSFIISLVNDGIIVMIPGSYWKLTAHDLVSALLLADSHMKRYEKESYERGAADGHKQAQEKVLAMFTAFDFESLTLQEKEQFAKAVQEL